MLCKVTFIFDYVNSDQKAAGWSETWYTNGQGIQTIINRASACAAARAGLLGNATKIIGYRIQELGKRAVMNFETLPGTLGTNQDIPQMALELKCYGNGVDNVKYFQVRGVPDALVTSGAYTPSTAFRQNLSLWAVTMVQNSMAFQCQNQNIAPVNIISMDGVGNFTLAGGGIALDPTQKVTLLRAKNVLNQNISGTYKIESVTDNQHGKLYGYAKGPLSGKAQMRLQTFIYPTVITPFVPIQISTRKVGRPFFAFRGRARKR